MKKLTMIVLMLLIWFSALAQFNPYIRNAWDTNDQSLLPLPSAVATKIYVDNATNGLINSAQAGALIAASNAVYTTQTIWVDPTNGNDVTAIAGRLNQPYQTLSNAFNYARSNQFTHIICSPGVYDAGTNFTYGQVPNTYITGAGRNETFFIGETTNAATIPPIALFVPATNCTFEKIFWKNSEPLRNLIGKTWASDR